MSAKTLEKRDGEELPLPNKGAEHGNPSPYLQKAMGEGGDVVDRGGSDYESVTDAASEMGLFTIVGGYLDEEGVVHNEVQVKSMSGREEELISNSSINILDRLNGVMVNCTERIGTITERGKIAQAINRLPMGSRRHLLICLRRVTHWKRYKDLYEMDIRCPIDDCQQVGSYQVNLGELEMFEMEDPGKREFAVKLLDSESEVIWRVASAPQEKISQSVRGSKTDDFRILTFAIMMRLISVDGDDVRLGVDDFTQGSIKKLRLSNRARKLYETVVSWTSGDREQLRESFILNEPDIETEVDIQCEFCKREFKGDLNLTQETFFFPSATSRRSKRKSFI